ncbi:uncharacterized protein LOC131159233 [Malania oleifera]|uniref:uncharacterized protein LOC131159233 n=1 Tax=Malania oleifera TaxID=397392 RepID=UPI0025AE79A2|nr:uncharacterized protein LOC131159233 [Malania oleifera]XP_057969954.1 uncharacterized protein LOC131159233 [Malania oleifera]
MVLGENTLQKTHYDILSVKEDASYEEIRSSYRSAILNFHPDKLQKTSEMPNHNGEVGDRFLQVQKAWEVLSNSKTRAAYDSELQAVQWDAEAAEDMSLEDMTVEDDGEVLELFRQCRCGDYFSVDSLELGKIGCVVLRGGSGISLETVDGLPASVLLLCGSCSLKVRLLINAGVSMSTEVDL